MYWLSFFNEIFRSKKGKKRTKEIELFSIADLEFPSYINKIRLPEMKGLLQFQLSTYSSLGFQSMEPNQLKEVKNYNSFEIALMLKYLQYDTELFIPNKATFFPAFIALHNENTIKQNIALIITKYNENVTKNDDKTTLNKMYIWSPFEVTFLLYYATIFKSNT